MSSRARWAASISALGGAKFGMPCARFTPPRSATTRVISRMTDSVKPSTRLESRVTILDGPGPSIVRILDGPGPSIVRRSAGERGHDRDLVTVLQHGLVAVEEADVLLVDVHVHEAAD